METGVLFPEGMESEFVGLVSQAAPVQFWLGVEVEGALPGVLEEVGALFGAEMRMVFCAVPILFSKAIRRFVVLVEGQLPSLHELRIWPRDSLEMPFDAGTAAMFVAQKRARPRQSAASVFLFFINYLLLYQK